MYSLFKHKDSRGFTLLELLIVIAIIAILATILIIIINPVEMLKRARDVQRLSDLATLKTAIGLYMVDESAVNLDGSSNDTCINVRTGNWPPEGTIFYSLTQDQYGTSLSDSSLDDTGVLGEIALNPGRVDGSGWIPVNLGDLAGSSPISNLPLDPINTVADENNVAYTDLVYRYACGTDPVSFEIDARLESDTYTEDDPKMETDGGNTDELYEMGTNLRVLGQGSHEF